MLLLPLAPMLKLNSSIMWCKFRSTYFRGPNDLLIEGICEESDPSFALLVSSTDLSLRTRKERLPTYCGLIHPEFYMSKEALAMVDKHRSRWNPVTSQ